MLTHSLAARRHMKESIMRIAFLLLALSPIALAQTPMPKSDPALPPPDLGDQGVGAAVPETASQYLQNDKVKEQYDPDPNLTLRIGPNGDKIEEYRQNGRIVMVKVTPKRGATYYFRDTDNDGKIDFSDSNSNVAPVYFKIYELE